MKITIELDDGTTFQSEGWLLTSVIKETVLSADLIDDDQDVYFVNQEQQYVLDKMG